MPEEVQKPDLNTSGTTTTDSTSAEAVEGNGTVGDIYLDDAFTKQYTTLLTNDEYYDNLGKGLTIKDMRGVLGIPSQFIPITDPRLRTDISYAGDDKEDFNPIANVSDLGRMYTEKIIRHIPLLLMTPGVPSFMTSFSKEQKTVVLAALKNVISETQLSDLITNESGKYYSLKFAYVDYFYYVNGMLRAAAVMMNIGDVQIDGKRLDSLNWMYSPLTGETDKFGHAGINKYLGPYTGAIAFFADAGSSVSDSFSNQTTQSSLASTMNSLADSGRELNFLVGNVGSVAGLQLNELTSDENLIPHIEDMQDKVNGLIGNGNIISNILGKAQTLLAGGRLVFPEIWSESNFGRSYSCNMKLVSPSGDKLSVYLNILVPIYHLLGFALPRQSTGQAYFSPFLIRAYFKGSFNVDMGLMTGLSITKGAEGQWAESGIPTVAEVNFDIKDLYEEMFMSPTKSTGDNQILTNITELDYIANSCGININDQEVMRTIKLFLALNVQSGWSDTVSMGIFGNVSQFFNQKMSDIFGAF